MIFSTTRRCTWFSSKYLCGSLSRNRESSAGLALAANSFAIFLIVGTRTPIIVFLSIFGRSDA